MHKSLECTIRGVSPLMMHNGRLANPLDPHAKRIKELSSKRIKTDADYEAMAKREWEGSIYLDEKNRPCIPGENVEAAMVLGGKKYKLGKECQAGILSEGDWVLSHDGPKDYRKLRDDPAFSDLRRVKLKGAAVIRCRPIFMPWSLRFTLLYLPDVIDGKKVVDVLETVGRLIGLGDFRPKYGRFVVEEVA